MFMELPDLGGGRALVWGCILVLALLSLACWDCRRGGGGYC